ncbi:hypothetical protein CBR_g49414 [Chara braunii]|uniref:Uncharacterized protein n=1 Tax=Chara braunii TaxID=69332 RepID=A0A388M4V9_CHABU|nr:hypothetical protein CBR_g49414 [Chara braunii]|eukprot:GBG89624.1 hypothetical protein CBR_g49414 [Chara braunii]
MIADMDLQSDPSLGVKLGADLLCVAGKILTMYAENLSSDTRSTAADASGESCRTSGTAVDGAPSEAAPEDATRAREEGKHATTAAVSSEVSCPQAGNQRAEGIQGQGRKGSWTSVSSWWRGSRAKKGSSSKQNAQGEGGAAAAKAEGGSDGSWVSGNQQSELQAQLKVLNRLNLSTIAGATENLIFRTGGIDIDQSHDSDAGYAQAGHWAQAWDEESRPLGRSRQTSAGRDRSPTGTGRQGNQREVKIEKRQLPSLKVVCRLLLLSARLCEGVGGSQAREIYQQAQAMMVVMDNVQQRVDEGAERRHGDKTPATSLGLVRRRVREKSALGGQREVR